MDSVTFKHLNVQIFSFVIAFFTISVSGLQHVLLMKQTWVKDVFYSIWWSSLFLPTPLIAVNYYFLVSLFHFILINSNSVCVYVYICYPLVLNFSPSFPFNRPLKTAIWKKWKRKYGLRNEKDEEMWIKIPQKKMWKKLRRDGVALPQRSCHQTPPN